MAHLRLRFTALRARALFYDHRISLAHRRAFHVFTGRVRRRSFFCRKDSGERVNCGLLAGLVSAVLLLGINVRMDNSYEFIRFKRDLSMKVAEVRKRIRVQQALSPSVRFKKLRVSSKEDRVIVEMDIYSLEELIALMDERTNFRLTKGEDIISFRTAEEITVEVFPASHKLGVVRISFDIERFEVGLALVLKSYEDVVKSRLRQLTQGNGKTLPRENGEAKEGDFEHVVTELHKLGVIVSLPSARDGDNKDIWTGVAGYEEVKEQIEEYILLAIRNPDLYTEVARLTRKDVKNIDEVPRAILFEGPPGCGKTSSARVISRVANVPLIYLPVEVIMSKFYGESENKLQSIFELCSGLGTSSIIFIDEIDSLATDRGDGVHEATRRLLSVLLRALDGFETKKAGKPIIIAATNRKRDLDPALLSRFNLSIRFDLPDWSTRKDIFSVYAKHLTESQLSKLAKKAEGYSGRDIKDVCELAERRHTSALAKKETVVAVPPSFKLYEEVVEKKI